MTRFFDIPLAVSFDKYDQAPGRQYLTALCHTPQTSKGGIEPIDPPPAGSLSETLLAALVPKAIEIEIYRALLENQAGEHAARMTAMEAATRNTEELIEKLTLDYNRARQAAITSELVEIVTGAQALE